MSWVLKLCADLFSCSRILKYRFEKSMDMSFESFSWHPFIQTCSFFFISGILSMILHTQRHQQGVFWSYIDLDVEYALTIISNLVGQHATQYIVYQWKSTKFR